MNNSTPTTSTNTLACACMCTCTPSGVIGVVNHCTCWTNYTATQTITNPCYERGFFFAMKLPSDSSNKHKQQYDKLNKSNSFHHQKSNKFCTRPWRWSRLSQCRSTKQVTWYNTPDLCSDTRKIKTRETLDVSARESNPYRIRNSPRMWSHCLQSSKLGRQRNKTRLPATRTARGHGNYYPRSRSNAPISSPNKPE